MIDSQQRSSKLGLSPISAVDGLTEMVTGLTNIEYLVLPSDTISSIKNNSFIPNGDKLLFKSLSGKVFNIETVPTREVSLKIRVNNLFSTPTPFSAVSLTYPQVSSARYKVDGGPEMDGPNVQVPPGVHILDITLSGFPQTISIHFRDIAAMLTDVIEWPSEHVTWFEFQNCSNLLTVPTTLPTSVITMSGMFSGCYKFNSPIGTWDTSRVTNMYRALSECHIFNQPLNNWEMMNVTRTDYMLFNCFVFNQTLSTWETPNLVQAQNMFANCNYFNGRLDRIKIDLLQNVTSMFNGATRYNQDLSNWIFRPGVIHNDFDSGTPAWQASYKPTFL